MKKHKAVLLFLFLIAGTVQCMKKDIPDSALVLPSVKPSEKPVKSLNGVQKNKKHKNGVLVASTPAPAWPYVKSTRVFTYAPDRFTRMSNLDKADYFRHEFLRWYPSETDLARTLEGYFMRAHNRE